jgi:hypothetical protein
MADSITWSFNASASSGGASKASGKTDVDGIMIVRTTLTADPDPVTLSLQLKSPGNVSFLAITSSAYDGDVAIKSGDVTVHLAGPLVLYGDAVAMFTVDLSTLDVTYLTGDPVQLSILVGFDPTPP